MVRMTSILKNSNYLNLSSMDKSSMENLNTTKDRDFSVEKQMVKFNKVCKSLEVNLCACHRLKAVYATVSRWCRLKENLILLEHYLIYN